MDIKCIDKATVHKICSGQVVLTLAVAVKELVENAIDAEATCIEIRLKEHGSKLIEVVDNGCGVEKKNFAGLTAKHHTSKISQFEDLDGGVLTFGFRGEALSSLCALGKLQITTRHKDTEIASKVEYDLHGLITNQTNCARPIGTTVTIQDIFHTLPVRHKEFLKNLKREFHRMITLLNAYCVISTGVKITCCNIQSGGKRSVIVGTNGGYNIRDNISAVFGVKSLTSLLKFVLFQPNPDQLAEFRAKEPSNNVFSISGYVSSSQHGAGRGSTDRQFYYINGRPCDLEKLSKLVNEIYHTCNKHQYPCLFLNIEIDKAAVDVNVTPDKRKVFLEYEAYLLATMKASLLALWEPEVSTFTAACPSTFNSTATETNPLGSEDSRKRTLSDVYASVTELKSVRKRASLDSFLIQIPRIAEEEMLNNNVVNNSNNIGFSCKERTIPDVIPSSSGLSEKSVSDLPYSSTSGSNDKLRISAEQIEQRSYSSNSLHSSDELWPNASSVEDVIGQRHSMSLDSENANRSCSFTNSDQNVPTLTPCSSVEALNEGTVEQVVPSTSFLGHCGVELDEPSDGVDKKTKTVTFSLLSLQERLASRSAAKNVEIECPKFRAKISPDQNTDAESELAKFVCKDDFKKMKVHGQFNLGFIVAGINSDLFIIDQHATDEKYNFEILQRDTVIKRQALLVPKPLHLSASNEFLVMDNLELFHKNGFEFVINENAEPTQRVLLKTQPVSKNWSFGKDDIDEILYMLRENPHQHYRPSRVRAMFASRACRKSIMIGRALNKAEMTKLLHHMAEIDQPWNCPHGRPTMRHLVNLDLIDTPK